MNKTYKVIYNRTRCMYQVVSELAKGHTKSATPEMLKSLFSKHSGLTRGIVMAVLSMSLAMPVGVAVQAADTAGTGETTTSSRDTTKADVDAGNIGKNLKTADGSAAATVEEITANEKAWGTAIGTGNIDAPSGMLVTDTAVHDELRPTDGTYVKSSQTTAQNLTKLDTQVGTNTGAITKNTGAITNLKNLSNLTEAGQKAIQTASQNAVKVAAGTNIKVDSSTANDGSKTYTVSAKTDGKVAQGNTGLVSGDTVNTAITNAETATNTKLFRKADVDAGNIGKNLKNADGSAAVTAEEITANEKAWGTAIGMGNISTPAGMLVTDTAVNAELRPDDGTYVKKANTTAANLSALDTNLKNVITAVGLDVDDTTKSYTSKLNKYFKVNPTSTTVADAAANGTNSVAIGPSAQVNETAAGGIAFGKGAVTGEDKGTVAVGDVTANVAAVGGENSVALGTDAKASGNTALALGKGAQVNNYTTQSGTTVTKTVNSGSTAIGSGAVVTGANDAVALGSGASVTGTGDNADDSMAIGKGALVATAKDAMALGTSAAVASGATNAVAIGNTAKANTSNTTAIGYNASATGAGAIAIGENTSTSTEGGISIGSGTSVSGKSIAIGYSSDGVTTGSDNTNAIAIGNGAQAYSNDSVSIGNQAGKGTSQGRNSGYGSLIAIGTNAGANVRGMQNVAMGSGAGSNVKSSYNVAIGSNAGSGINNAGDDNNPQNGYNVSIGFGANYNKDNSNQQITESIAVGREANAASNATAIGYEATANDVRSIAIGYNTTAGHKATGTTSSDVDAGSIAIGDSAKAMGGNIAIGTSSTAPATATLGTVGDDGYIYKTTPTTGTDESTTTTTSVLKSPFTNKSLLATSTYVSVGDASNSSTRRISNVADGVFDSDAATVGQLNALNTSLVATTSNLADAEKYFDERFTTLNDNIDKIKYKYFSVSTDADTLTANQNNDGASTTSPDAMAIGPNAKASSAKAVAIGNNVSASGKGSIALGTADNPATSVTVKEGENISANPHVTSAEGANSVAIGTSAIAQTDNSVALGTRASVYTSDVIDKNTNNTVKVGQRSIAIGYESETRNSDATSIGSGAKAYSTGSTAVGHGAFAQGTDAIVLGASSRANGASSGILGKSNTVNGSNTYAVGSENKVDGNWGAVTYSGLYGSKNIVTPVSDTSGNTKHGMDSLSVTGNSNTISQGSYSDTVQNISILGNGNSVTGAHTDEANAGTTANITVIGGNNEVTGRDGAGSDDMGKTWNQLTRTTVIGYGNTVNQATSTTSLADTQILGNDVTATLGNSVYLGTGSSAKNANSPDTDTLKKAETDAANAVDTTGMTDDQKATALSDAKAKARYAVKLAAMKANNGSTAGTEALNTDTTYDDGTSYTYAGSSPVGVVTVGSAGKERRIQNVAAGLVSASSTDAVNGSQLYALTRQLRFGGDNSSFGTTTADDKNVVARGSNETLNIIGGEKDATKLTDNNIGVMADSTNNSLSVKLASDLKKLNTASLGSGSGDSYKETIKLDGTNGKVTVADSSGTVKTTLDTTGLTIAGGPKFTSSGIDAASQKITSVKAGEADTDAANVGQVKSARTLLTQGTNTTLGDVEADGHHTYTVNVDNLAVKAATGNASVALANGINFKNGTNTTSSVDTNGNVTIDTKNLTLKANRTNTATVTMDNGINFKNGTNTTATVGADGTVTINATHNKLESASYTASKPSDTSNQTTVKLKDTDGNETTLNLTDTYTTVSKNTDHTITFKRNDGSTPVSISLDDLNGASKEALATAAAKATTQVIAGANVSSVDDTNVGNPDGPHVYKVNVSNLGVKVADGQKKSVALSDGLVFGNGTNTTASVGDNGAITFNVSNEAIKTQAKDAINMTAGSNVKVETATSTDGLSKTFTISATHNTLKSAKLTKGANDVSTLTITGNDGDTASVDIKNTYLTVSKNPANKTVTFTSNDGITPATTLSLSDFGAASTTDMTAAVGKATTEVRAGANASLGTVETDTTDQHKIYTVNVDNLGVSQNGTKVGTGVSLKDGLNFTDGTNTTASVAENGTVSYSVSNDAIKAQAKDAVVVASGDNVSIDAPTDANNVKTYTVKVNDLKLQANGEDKGTRKLAEGINFANGKNTTATVEDGKVVYSLNDALTDLTSVTARDTTGNQTLVSGSGVTITPAAAGAQPISLTTNGLSIGNQQITNVKSGGDTDTNAANISDVKRLVQASANGTTETGFNVKGDDATAKRVKLGKQLNVVGGTTDSTQLSTGNIGVETTADAEGNATLTVKLKKDIALDSVTTGSSTLDTNGLTITGGPSVLKSGINAGNQKITGVLAGTDTMDAVNKGQLDALANTVNGGWTIQAGNATGNAQIVKPGNKVTLDAGNNLNLTQNGTAFTYSLAEDLTGLKSVTAGDAKTNQAVLTGEGLKVTDKEGNSLTQHTTEIRLHSSNTDTADTSKDVVLDNSGLIVGNNIKFTNSGISAGNQKITNVADGELKEGSKEAVNGGQLYELKQQVGSGWKLTGDDTAQATNIGAGAQVSVKSGNFAKVTVNKSDSGATIQYDVQTQEITTNGGKAKTAKDGVATTQDVVNAINDSYWTVTSGQTGTGKATGTAVSNVTAGTAVTLHAGDNLLLNQAGNSFTYALNPVVTGMTSISFTGMGTGSDGNTVNDLVIGLQNGGGANPNKGYYITGLSNTEWNQSNYQGDRAATEAQLKKAIENVSIVKGGGGYGLTADEGANNGGDKNVTQALGSTIAVRGDGTYDEKGKLVKAGNVKTVAYTDAAGSGQTGAIQIQLNKDINLGTDGSFQAGGVTLKNNSVTVGTNGVLISSSGTDRTVSNLSNIHWDTAKANQEAAAGGYIGSTKAATESQLAEAITTATNTASANEQHIRNGSYSVQTIDNEDGTKSQGVSIDIITGDGTKPEDVKGKVVIKDVAKASDVGDVSELHDTLKNADGKKNVTGALNNLDDRVSGLDNRMDQIYTTAGQHSSVSAEDNIQVNSQSKNGTGGTDYKLSLNKEKIDLKNVTIEGNAGAVTAKTVTAEKYNVGDKTYISSDGINANSQKITNVQTGTADTDAANVGQMREADAQLADAIQQTDAGLNEVGRAVNKLGNRLNRVGAGAAALAALHPGTYDPNDKWDFSAGVGHYHDANAVAIGAYYHPNDTTILSIGGSMGGGENMVNAGITWKMGRSSHEQAAQPVVVRKVEAAPVVQQAAPVRTAPVVTPAPVTTPAPVKSVASTTPVHAVPAVTMPMTQATTGDTSALAQILARQTAILEKLAQNQSQAVPSAAVAHGDDIFPDVPDNHWAYAYVAKLEKAGALKGFKRPAVLKSPMMTRDDFASVLYTAMANGATTNPALNGDDSLNRLAQEFKAELKNVKV